MDQDPSPTRKPSWVKRVLGSPYTAPAALLVLVMLFFFITVVVAVQTGSDTVTELVELQRKVADTNNDLVNLGRAQVCIGGTDLADRRPATTNWCLTENGQAPLYPGVSPEAPTSPAGTPEG